MMETVMINIETPVLPQQKNILTAKEWNERLSFCKLFRFSPFAYECRLETTFFLKHKHSTCLSVSPHSAKYEVCFV